MHHAVGFAALVAAITFAFGQRTAQVFVGAVLVIGTAFCIWIAVLVVTNQI